VVKRFCAKVLFIRQEGQPNSAFTHFRIYICLLGISSNWVWKRQREMQYEVRFRGNIGDQVMGSKMEMNWDDVSGICL
jgi:hypothetical protein